MYQLLQYQQAAKQLMLLQCSLALYIGICTLYAVLYLQAGITGILWSQTSSTIIAAGGATVFFTMHQQSAPSLQNRFMPVSYYLWYGLPFIPGILASWILSSANRWLLGYFMTMQDVGIYAVADLATQLFYVIILQSWANSYLPYIMQQYQQNPDNLCAIEHDNHNVMWNCMIMLAIIMCAGYPIGYRIIAPLLPIAYRQSLRYVLILLLGQLFLLGSYFAAALIQYTKHTYFLAAALCIPAFCNIVLNFIFIPYWGIMGCAIATLLSYGMYFMIIYRYNKKIMHSYNKKGISFGVSSSKNQNHDMKHLQKRLHILKK
jgi:O-antigen/teichoic acid export membrane protein